jgi:hypothetical protein
VLPEHLEHHVDRHRVEAGERLVEHQHVRVVHQRRGDLRPLLVAQRQVVHRVGEALAETEALQQVTGAGGRIATVEPVQPCQVGDLVDHRHLRVEPALLRHVAETAAALRAEGAAVQRDRARVRGEHPEQDAHRGRLARAVAADKPGQPAASHREPHVVQHPAAGEGPADPVELQHVDLLS